MKNRHTFTLDPEITLHAKRLAHKRGTSLSSLVETLLAKEIGYKKERLTDTPSFSERWAGKMELAEKDDPRFHALKSKYNL